MEYLFLSLLVFGSWWLLISALYWVIIRKVLPELTPDERRELLKTRRQRNLER